MIFGNAIESLEDRKPIVDETRARLLSQRINKQLGIFAARHWGTLRIRKMVIAYRLRIRWAAISSS